MKKKDMSLYYNNHLNEISHFENPEIKKQKEEVFKAVVEFDKWYRENCHHVTKREYNGYWKVGSYHDKEDTVRLGVLKEKVIPTIPNCHYITPNLKNETLKRSKAEDPQNLGVMLTNHVYGESLRYLTFYQSSIEHSNFTRRQFLYSDRLKSEWDETPQRMIPQEEALFYHLSMIKLINESKAIYRVHTGMTNAPMSSYGYLILELIKSNDNWLIDYMYYISKEELIEDPRDEKGLMDYNQGYPGIEIP